MQRPFEVSACRMMLPEAFKHGTAPELFVATSKAPLSALENIVARGQSRVRFFCYDDNRDTLKLARRAGAEIRKVESFYALDLTREGLS